MSREGSWIGTKIIHKQVTDTSVWVCGLCLTPANAVVNNLQSTKQGVGKIEGHEQKCVVFSKVAKDVICTSLSGHLGIVTSLGHYKKVLVF